MRSLLTLALSLRAPAPSLVFSGIVEEMGVVEEIRRETDLTLWDGSKGEGYLLKVNAADVLDGAYLGCSIAVNGVCLTVTDFDDKVFAVGLAPETIRRTNLENLVPGAPVNLERALAADGRNSGHYVQGHVDDTGTIEEIRPDGDALWIRVRPPPRLLPYIVPKGFIAVDGTSLTVCESNQDEGWFDFMLVSYTQSKIILPLKKLGDTVNLEVDVTAKYVERALGATLSKVEELQTRMEALEALISKS